MAALFRKSGYLVLGLSLFQLARCQIERPDNVPTPTFFISLTSVCRFNNAEIDPGDSFAAEGSLCAYAEDANIVYSCPAGDAYCWNLGGQCSGGSSTTPGTNQTACSDIGSGTVHWCCNSQFGNCTQTPFQQNNCWSWFDNPNRSLNSLAASSSASVAMAAAVSEPTVTNIVVNAVADGGWVVASQTASTAASTAVSTGTARTDSVVPPNSAATLSSNAQSGSLSGGATAGIAIGAAALAAITTAVFFLWRRWRNEKLPFEKQVDQQRDEPGGAPYMYKPGVFGNQMNELSSETKPIELDSAELQKPAIKGGSGIHTGRGGRFK